MEPIDEKRGADLGIVAGSFLPLTLDAVERIHQFSQAVDQLAFLVPGEANDVISIGRRLNWIREVFPGASVKGIETEKSSVAWASIASVRSFFPGRTQLMHDRLLLMDPSGDLDLEGISPDKTEVYRSTLTRNEFLDKPLLYLDRLPIPVRSWFALRIVVTGAESTGKTTLAHYLGKRFGVPVITEMLRAFVEQNNRLPGEADMIEIARAQTEQTVRAAKNGSMIVVSDTDPLSLLVYSQYYFGRVDPDLEALVGDVSNSLYLFTQPDIPWIADPGQRDGVEVRDVLHREFQTELKRRELRVQVIRGSRTERIMRAINGISNECIRQGTNLESLTNPADDP